MPVSQPTNTSTNASLDNKQKETKTTAKSKKSKSWSTLIKKNSTSKIPKAKVPSTRKQAKHTTTNGNKESSDKASNPISTQKAPVRWEDDKNKKGESAMSILLKWITTFGNWKQYKDGNIVKKTKIQLVIDYLAENGIDPQKIGAVADKNFTKGSDWLNRTGQGVMLDLGAEKEQNGWTDYHPKFLEQKNTHIEGVWDKSTWLSSTNSAIQTHPDFSLECLGYTAHELAHLQVSGKNSALASQNTSIGPLWSCKGHKPGVETQANQIIALKESEIPSALSKLEKQFVENKHDDHDMKDAIKDLKTGFL
ncbi:hypothetical protein DFH28DRAFT_1201906 [Melampsora americana]|nr:hypothetical protein DFH28DRAFT_1201906 [Melampsora americana]